MSEIPEPIDLRVERAKRNLAIAASELQEHVSELEKSVAELRGEKTNPDEPRTAIEFTENELFALRDALEAWTTTEGESPSAHAYAKVRQALDLERGFGGAFWKAK